MRAQEALAYSQEHLYFCVLQYDFDGNQHRIMEAHAELADAHAMVAAVMRSVIGYENAQGEWGAA